MCLGVPGEVISLQPDPLGMTMGRVRFGGITKEACLAYVPDVKVGDFVLVHVGFALAIIDEAEARRTRAWLAEEGALDALAPGEEGAGP